MTGERIRVELERSGGFGGLLTRRTLDTAELPPEAADELRRLVAEADLDAVGDLAGGASGGVPVPDAYHYRLSVLRDGRRWDLSLTDPQVPGTLRPLLRRLLTAAP